VGSGFDPKLGDYIAIQLSYDLVRSGLHTEIVGHYVTGIPVQQFISFGNWQSNHDEYRPLDMDHVRTIFPSFHIEQIDTNDQRGYFTFEGKIDF